MDDGGSPSLGILIFVIVILLDFVIFGFIAAMQNLNEASVEKMAKDGDSRAALLLNDNNRTERYMHVCQLLIVAVHMLLGFFEIPLWERFFVKEPAPVWVSAAAYVLVCVALVLLVLAVGIYTPQKVASRKPEPWALFLAKPIHAVEILFFPAIFIADGAAKLLSRIFGVDPLSNPADVTEEEIISMVNEGHEHGVLLASEAEMIHNIFEFGDKEVKDIMTHRKNMIVLDGTQTFLEALSFIKDNNYSRFPVYEGDIDNIIGVLHIKEALALSQEKAVFEKPIRDIEGLVREVDFIPETRNIDTLFTEMQSQKSHMVIVVDEYGQTSGIVAMEDILEEIVGNIEDEHDEEEHMIVPLTDGSYLMDGMAAFPDVLNELGIEPEDEDTLDFETLNGFLISLIDKIPSDNEIFSTEAFGYLFEIFTVENKMVRSVKVTRLQEQSGMGEDSAEEKNGAARSREDETTTE